VVQKLLLVIPKHLSQVAIAIEVIQDLSKLTLEDVGGRLRMAEDRAMDDDALLLIEEQWKEKACQRSDDGQSLSGGDKQRQRPRKGGNGGKKGA
jgi:hypothetical protein